MSVVEGHFVVRGQRFPLSELSSPSKIQVTESREEPPIHFKMSEIVRFGLVASLSDQDLQSSLSESVVFGETMALSEDLQNNLSESVTITNA